MNHDRPNADAVSQASPERHSGGPPTTCPNCTAEVLQPIYEVRRVPAHSCLLMETREEALAYPTADITLAWCRACGFATNTAFDVEMNAYSRKYEEVQTFSPTFASFASQLVEHLVEQRGVRHKDVVEIGCGKGEFLTELCARGTNRGVGIDPSYVEGRGPWKAAGVRFINELYSAERHASHPADVVICRHTLEHLPSTRDFIRTLRSVIGHRDDTLVFFELPDQLRVYEERAFWDIYYEHCSYFTAGALERLFLANGFEILKSWKGFGDQYLLIEAQPLRPGEAGSYDVRENLDELGRTVRGFAAAVPRVIARWRAHLGERAARGERVVLWGAGSKGVAFLTTLGIGDDVLRYAVDVNPHKWGCFMPGAGQEVVSPGFLEEYRPDTVIVMNPAYTEDIRRQLAEMHLEPDLLAVGVNDVPVRPRPPEPAGRL